MRKKNKKSPEDNILKNNINVINQFIYILENKFVYEMSKDDHPLSFLSQTVVQLSLRRVVELLKGMKNCMSHKLALPAILCARALVETVVDLYVFEKKFVKSLEERKFDELIKITDNHVRKTRDENKLSIIESPRTTNIQTEIEKFDKEFCGSLEFYKDLSGLCHPNYEGGFGLYANHDGKSKGLDALNNKILPLCDFLKSYGASINIIGDFTSKYDQEYRNFLLSLNLNN